MIPPGLRNLIDKLRGTPLHPQWLLSDRGQIIDRLRAIHGGVVLDIGCADRWTEAHLASECRYIGLDSVFTGASMYGARPTLFGDAARLPIAGNSVDCVLFFEVLEHLRAPRDALREIARVLRPGGKLLMSVPFLYPIHDAPHDYQRYTIHGLERELQAVGLRIEQIHPSLGSLECAGLIACLALAGTAIRSAKQKSPSILLAPVLIALVPLVNLLAWLGGKLFPGWPAITSGYTLVATSP